MATVSYTPSIGFHHIDFDGVYLSKEDLVSFKPPRPSGLLETLFSETKAVPFNFHNELFSTIEATVKAFDEEGVRLDLHDKDIYYRYASVEDIQVPVVGSFIKATVFNDRILSFAEIDYLPGANKKLSIRQLNPLYSQIPLNSSQRAIVSIMLLSNKGSLLLLTEGSDLHLHSLSEYILPHKLTKSGLMDHLVMTPSTQPLILAGLERYQPSMLNALSELLVWDQLDKTARGSRSIIATSTRGWFNSHYADFEGKFMHTIIIDELSSSSFDRNESIRLSRSLSVQQKDHASVDIETLLNSGYEEPSYRHVSYIKTELNISLCAAKAICYGYSKVSELTDDALSELVKIFKGSIDEDLRTNNTLKSTPKVLPKSKKKRTELVVEYLQSICEEKESDFLSKSEILEVMISMNFSTIQAEELLENLNIGGYLLQKGPMYKLSL